MIKRLILWAFALLPALALAQSTTGGNAYVPGGNGATSKVFYVGNYGAVCTNVFNGTSFVNTSDDTAAINRAFAAARTYLATNGIGSAKIVFPSGAACGATAPINGTMLNPTTTQSLIIDGQGSVIEFFTTGAAADLDLLGSTNISVQNLTISSAQAGPTNGIQIGRVNTTALDSGGNKVTLFNVQVSGLFSVAACYNFSGEQIAFFRVTCINATTTGGYGLVQDGANHFNVTSTFVTENAPVDTYQSFTLDKFDNSTFISFAAAGAAIWMENASQQRFIASYADNAANTSYCVDLFNTVFTAPYGNNRDIQFDLHCESPSLKAMFLLTGPGSGANFTATPVIRSLTYQDAYIEAGTNIFLIDAGKNITGVTLQNPGFNVSGGPTSPAVTVFDVPASYSVSYPGQCYFYAPAIWNGTTACGASRVVASVTLTAQGANISATTMYTPPANGTYMLCADEPITRVATASSTTPYVEPDFVSALDSTTKFMLMPTSIATNMAYSDNSTCSLIYALGGNAIQYATTGYASSGATSMQYGLNLQLISLNPSGL